MVGDKQRNLPMTTDPKPPTPKPPKNIKVDVINPDYEGATFEMVVKAMLQRPRKEKKAKGEEPETD